MTTATAIKQASFADLVGELKWTNRDVSVDDLPIPMGVEPDKAFVESIAKVGVTYPVLLIERPKGGYVLIDGNRRVRAAIEAGLKAVPARVVPAGEIEVGILTLMMNEQRSANPVVEYWAIKNLMEENGRALNESQLSKLTGMPVQTIKKRLRLDNLSPDFMAVFELGDLTPSMAERIAKLDKVDQASLWAVWNDQAGRITADDLRAVREASRPQIENLGLPGMPEPTWGASGFSPVLEDIGELIERVTTRGVDAVEVVQSLEAIRSSIERLAVECEG